MSKELIEALLEEASMILHQGNAPFDGNGRFAETGDEAVFGLRAEGRPVRVIAADLGCDIAVVEEAIDRARRRRPGLDLTEERIAWELHRAVAEKLQHDRAQVVEIARRNLARLRQEKRQSPAAAWIEEWESLLDGDPRRLLERMLASDEHAADLRRLAPFAGSLTEAERLLAIRKASLTG